MTLLYLITSAIVYHNEATYAYSYLAHAAVFFGLFVPYGFLSWLLMFYNLLSIPIFFLTMFYAEWTLNKENVSLGKRILFNLIALLLITIVIDLVRFTPFASWNIFFSGHLPRF